MNEGTSMSPETREKLTMICILTGKSADEVVAMYYRYMVDVKAVADSLTKK